MHIKSNHCPSTSKCKSDSTAVLSMCFLLRLRPQLTPHSSFPQSPVEGVFRQSPGSCAPWDEVFCHRQEENCLVCTPGRAAGSLHILSQTSRLCRLSVGFPLQGACFILSLSISLCFRSSVICFG